MARKTYAEKLRKWRQKHEEEYAKAIMSPPEHTKLLKAIPFPGTILVMGARRKGKSALAHDIAEKLHNKRGLPAVLHLPRMPSNLQKQIQSLLPPWMELVTSTERWPKHSIVIYDEASQGAHARRTQSGEAVELDNLIGISGQRQQLIIFISHHSRKLDLNVVRDVDLIAWKIPTYSHWMFERNEFSDFVLKAIDFFRGIRSEPKALKTTLVMDFHNLRFQEFTNGLPSYWSDRLSHLFEDIRCIAKGGGTMRGYL